MPFPRLCPELEKGREAVKSKQASEEPIILLYQLWMLLFCLTFPEMLDWVLGHRVRN